ncbi:MAG: T9SS type A sorting domain-containing protein [Saprospiraceae bacterium]
MLLLSSKSWAQISFTCATSCVDYSSCSHDHQVATRSASPITKAYCEPPVILESQQFKMILETDKDGIDSILVVGSFSPPLYIRVNPLPILTLGKFTMYDDGTRGDEIAGDKKFTFTQPLLTGNFNDVISCALSNAEITLYSKSNVNVFTQVPLNFGVRIKPNRYKNPQVKKISAEAQVTEYVLNIVTDKYDSSPEVIKKYYQYLPDDRDFILHLSTYGSMDNFPIAAAYYNGVQNDVVGIYPKGSSSSGLYNNSSLYNSKRLQGIIQMLRAYSAEHEILTHELLHRWGLNIAPALGISLSFHYGWVFSEEGSMFNGSAPNRLTILTDSTVMFAYGPTSNDASNFELYLMGLASIDSVKWPIQVLKNASFLKDTTAVGFVSGARIFKHKGIQNITKSDFLNVMDLRSPGPNSSQKNFTLGTIVTSHRLLTPEELSIFDNKIREYGLDTLHQSLFKNGNSNFNIAVKGKAKLTTRLPVIISTKSDDIHALSNMIIWPNPTSDKFKIKNSLARKYVMYTADGRVVLQIDATNEDEEIDILHLQNGLYYLKSELGQTSKILKIN